MLRKFISSKQSIGDFAKMNHIGYSAVSNQLKKEADELRRSGIDLIMYVDNIDVSVKKMRKERDGWIKIIDLYNKKNMIDKNSHFDFKAGEECLVGGELHTIEQRGDAAYVMTDNEGRLLETRVIPSYFVRNKNKGGIMRMVKQENLNKII